MDENEVARVVVDAAVEVHRVLGGLGLLVINFGERLVRQGIHRVVNVL